jgi:hypothetical protein
MSDFDKYADELIEKSKYFLAKGKADTNRNAQSAYLQSSVLFAFSALDAHVYSICDELYNQGKLSLHEKAFLMEKDVLFKDGKFIIASYLKMTRATERIEYLYRYFTKKKIDKTKSWWSDLKEGQDIRNNIVHPKERSRIKIKDVEKSIMSVLDCVNILFENIYKKSYPLYKYKLENKLSFD